MTLSNKTLVFFLMIVNLSFSQSNSSFTQEQVLEDAIRQKNHVLKLIYGYKEMISELGYKDLAERIPKDGHKDGKININFLNIDDGIDEKFKGTIAIALGSGDDSQINIVFDYINWKRLNIDEKMATVLHELCHDAFNFKHVDWDELSLMHPNSQPKSEKSTVMMFMRMLDNYKNGMYETFTPNEIYIHSESEVSKRKTYDKRMLN